MAMMLRQSTASQEILLGPFVDSTDGNTAETGLSIANTDIKIFKEGATTLADKNSGGATHISNGYYYAVLDATDTNTVGQLEVNVKVSGALAVRREFQVLEEAVYDALFAASAAGYQVPIWASASSTVNLSGTTIATLTNAPSDSSGVTTLLSRIGGAITITSGRVNADITHIAAAAVSTSTAQLGVNVVNFGGVAGTFASGRPEVNTTHAAGTAWGSGAITAGSIASSAITSAKFASGAITSTVLAADCIGASQIATGAIDRAALAADTGLQPARSSTAQAGAAGSITLDASASSTTDFYRGQIVYITGGTGAGQSRVITAYNGTTKVATVSPNWWTNPDNTSTFAVLAEGPADLDAIGGTAVSTSTAQLGVNLVNIAGAAVNTSTAQIGVNVVNFGGSAGTFASGRPEVNTSHIAGSAVSTSTAQIGVNVVNAGGTAWASGSLTSGVFAAGAINAAAIATGAIDADALATDAVAEIADGVWDEALSGHLTAGSTGEALNAAGAAGDPWTTTLPGAYTGSQAGKILSDILVDTGTTLQAELDGIQADTEDIQARLPAALVGGRIDANVGAISADSVAADNCEAFFDGTGYAGTNNVIPTVTNVTTVNGLAAGVITTASIADNAITTGKIDVTAYDTMASTVWEDSVALHTTPGTFGGYFATITSIDGKVDTIDTVVDAIKVKTDYLPSATAGAAGGVFIAGSNAATTVNITGNLTGNVTGTIGGLSAGALADFFDTNSGTTYASAVAGSVVKEIADNAGGSGLTAGAIADAVWDEAISGHLTSGTTGNKLNAASSAGDPWSTSLPGTYTGTEAGAILGTLRSSTMTVSHPVPSEDNTIELVIGDDYYAADSRNLSFSYGATPSLSGATVKFKIQLEETDTGYSSTNTSTTTTGSVSGTNPQVVTFDIPGTTTDDLSEGWHDYEVEATLSNGHVVTLTRGRVEMLSQVV